jgi:hypothetical protein
MVMPNHVHMLVTPRVQISVLMQSLKRFTARQANQMLVRTGQPFWQDESYDHLVRNQTEFERIVSYIEMNPVRAGIVASCDLFPWSGAWPIDNRPAGYHPAPQASTSERDPALPDHLVDKKRLREAKAADGGGELDAAIRF